MTLPIGYTVRAASIEDAEETTFVHVKAWQESYKGIVDQDYLDNISYEKRLAWRKKIIQENFGLQLVATFKGKVIGFCDSNSTGFSTNRAMSEKQNQKRDEKGEIYGLYLLEKHQGKGIGKELLRQSLKWLREKELSPIIVWALKDNQKARAFYESQGGKVVDEIQIEIGNKSYFEVGYRFL